MRFLLLVGHGSRKQAANDEIQAMAETVRELEDCDFDGVQSAFLEIAEPNIHDGIARCVELGADSIVVVPYFLAAGKHVSRDIPAELECARAGHPQVNISLSRYLGANEAMAGLVLSCSRQFD
jgi:sirohydrochlorin ferrochelatase